jgi:hypothetical protein
VSKLPKASLTDWTRKRVIETGQRKQLIPWFMKSLNPPTVFLGFENKIHDNQKVPFL